MESKKTKAINRAPKEMLLYYQQKLARLENIWFDLYDYFPIESTVNFWGNKYVIQVEAMISLWWDIVQIRTNNGKANARGSDNAS